MFMTGKKNSRNYEDKTPYKIQVMRDALCTVPVGVGNGLYGLKASKRLYDKYIEAYRKSAKGLELTPSEKTHLYGYLNPRYRFAEYPKKHIRGKRSK